MLNDKPSLEKIQTMPISPQEQRLSIVHDDLLMLDKMMSKHFGKKQKKKKKT